MIHFLRFQSTKHLELFVNGAYLLGPVQSRYPVVGETLTLSRPGYAVPAPALTFAAGRHDDGLTLAELMEQITDGASELNYLRVRNVEGMIYLEEAAPLNGVAFANQAQDALAHMGKVATGAITTQVFGGPSSGKRSRIVAITGTGGEITLAYETADPADVPSSGGYSMTSAPAGPADLTISPPSNWVRANTSGNLHVHLVGDPPATLHTFTVAAGEVLRLNVDLVKHTTTTVTNAFFSQR